MNSVIKLKIKPVVLCLSVLLFLSVLLLFPSISSDGIRNGLNYSVNLLIPSLFPFMVLSSFVIRSDFSKIIGKIFAPITKFLFKLPAICSSAIILSLVGGFPVGAKCVQLLYKDKKITENQVQQMMLFCVCSGPAFLITAVGSIMLQNTTVGIILYISQIISCIILGIISPYICSAEKKQMTKTFSVENTNTENKSIVSSFVLSCSDGASSIIEMTALVLIFSLFINVFEKEGITSFMSDLLSVIGIKRSVSDVIIPIVLEVTGACSKICNGSFSLWVVSFAVGFGGLCVHLQIFDILKDIKINKIRFMVFRFVNAALSSTITYVICLFYTPVTDVFATSEYSETVFTSSTIAGTVALVFMCIIFLMSLKKSRFSRKKYDYPVT